MELLLERMVAVGALPVRRGSQLIPLATPLYPDAGVGLYAAAQAGTVVFRVQGRVAAAGAGQQCVLQGYLDENPEPVFASAGFALTAAWEVPVALVVAPQGFLHLREVVQWVVIEAETGKRLAATATVLDLCFVPGLPAGAEQGVPYEGLLEIQQALVAAGANGATVATVGGGHLTRASYQGWLEDAAAVTRWIFERNPPAYDTLNGSSSYISYSSFNAITLNYTSYLEAKNKPNSTCNCYDLAALVQYLVRYSAGVDVKFAFMKPFGYLRKTELIGRGQCNNPFYELSWADHDPVCKPKAQNRTAFGNHAFGYLPTFQVVADACAGPHLCTETLAAYLANAQDPDCFYPQENGTVNDVGFYQGVRTVTAILPPSDPRRPVGEEPDHGFAKAVGFARATLPAADAVRVAALPPLLACPYLGPGWQVLADEVAPGYPLVRHQVVLGGPQQGSLRCAIWVASDGCHSAQRQYLDLGNNTSLPTTAFGPGPATLGDSAGQVLGRTAQRYLWLWHNFVFDLRADGPAATAIALAVAQWLQTTLESIATPLASADLPRLASPGLSRSAVVVGEEVVVRATCPPNCTVVVAGDHPGLYLAEEQADLFRFRAVRPSDNTLYLYAVDQQSLLASQQELAITVS